MDEIGGHKSVVQRNSMTIQLRPELEQLIQKDIELGGYQSVEQFVERAIQLLHDEEHLHQESKGAIHAVIGDGLAQLDRGEGIPAIPASREKVCLDYEPSKSRSRDGRRR
jgi:Arc/MetJ-type ribon-helix-helix transcriptional regulator